MSEYDKEVNRQGNLWLGLMTAFVIGVGVMLWWDRVWIKPNDKAMMEDNPPPVHAVEHRYVP